MTHSARRTRWLAASVLGVLLVAALGAPRALAQGEPGGRITGTVTLGFIHQSTISIIHRLYPFN